jgi:thioredoxin-related protein
MSKQNIPVLTLTHRLTGTVAQHRFVTAAGAQAGADANALGAARLAGVSGEDVPVDVLGTAIVEAGAAIAAGATLKSDASGRAITWVTAGAKVASALQAAGGGPSATALDDSRAVDVSYPDWFRASFLDLHDDLRQARAGGKMGILVFFGTRTCSYCQAFLDTTFADAAIVARVQRHFDVIGLEVLSDAEITTPDGRPQRADAFAVEEKARFTPTLIFYGDGGRRLLQLVGYHPPGRFRAILDYLEGRRYETQTLRQYLDARPGPAPAARGALTADRELFAPPPHRLDRRAPGARPLLVIFERPDCPPCDLLHRVLLRQPAVRASLRRFEVVQLDQADDRSLIRTPDGQALSPGAWAGRLGLLHAPAFVFFEENGNEVLRIDAETGRYRLEGALQYVLEKAYRDTPQFQQWRRKKALESRAGDRRGAAP